MEVSMDKLFYPDVPVLPADRLEQMTEFALSHRQHVVSNENRRARFWTLWRVGALSMTACLLLALASLYFQSSPVHDAYSDVTELAILETLDHF
jgi:hypothetical protein